MLRWSTEEDLKKMNIAINKPDHLTASAEEIWAELKHESDAHLSVTLEALRNTRTQVYNRLLSFRFGVAVYPNIGFFKARPAPNAPDGYFVSTPTNTFSGARALPCVASEDAGYSLAVDRLGLAGFLSEQMRQDDIAVHESAGSAPS
jgi:hypothetical protein